MQFLTIRQLGRFLKDNRALESILKVILSDTKHKQDL